MKVFTGADELQAAAGEPLGTSDRMTIDQQRVNAFADATEDHQFIHVDPEAAARTPFGGTVAHGFLSLSLLSR
ncbi:MAG: MaoC family dehydratase N-terminal domain-containing protein, partial [Actinomycetota bacterium]|nr:MaoC family dehydratase N-terminal domain-containing protein [Actinomycetota bacterium]